MTHPTNPSDPDALGHLSALLHETTDAGRPRATDKRHSKGYRTARENLNDLIDEGSLVEYGQLAVAAQRDRRDADTLRVDTATDGVITGTAMINAAIVGEQQAHTAVAIYDYSVLAGTQGFFLHE